MSPGTPFAGSDVHFVAAGLQPWDVLEVTFIEPDGQEAVWIRDDHFTSDRSAKYFLADRNGEARWTRYGAQDQVGEWAVHIRIDDSLSVVRYSYTKFELPRRVQAQLGVPLYGCRSDEAVIFFSDSVNFAITVDLHARLELAADLMEQHLGVRTAEIPIIYMLGNQADFESSQRASGVEPGWEAGFFRSYGEYPGIYIQSDGQKTDVYHTLTHEYVHFLLDEITGGAPLPIWLNEGLAGYYEFEVGRQGDFPDASYARMLWSGDTARNAAVYGQLFALRELESHREWNRRSGELLVSLQYAQSHMAVRYLTERYGESAPIEIVREISRGATLNAAMTRVTGVNYARFESGFVNWLTNWDDPVRAATRRYMQVLNQLSAEEDAIRALRSEAVREWNLHFDRGRAKESAIELQSRAANLYTRVAALQPPPYVADLHNAAVAYFRILRDWLTEDSEFLATGHDSYRVAANAMIPEVGYRRFDFITRLNDVSIILNLNN